VPQAREHAGPVLVVVMIAVVLVLVAVMVITVVMVMTVVVLVEATVVVVVTVIQVRAVHGVHDIQNARINALPHIDKYQGRALANCPQYAWVASPGDHERRNVKKQQVRELSRRV
jgi:cell division protein FtsW (lipid II flippase)